MHLNNEAARRTFYRSGGSSKRRRGRGDDVSGSRSGASACSLFFHGGFPIFAGTFCSRFIVIFLFVLGKDLLCSSVGFVSWVGFCASGRVRCLLLLCFVVTEACVRPRACWRGWVEGPGSSTANAPLSRTCCGLLLVSFFALVRGEVGGWGSRRALVFSDDEHSDAV